MLYCALVSIVLLLTMFGVSLLFSNFSLIQTLPYSIILIIGVQCALYGFASFANVGFNGILSIVFNLLLCGGCAFLILRRLNRTSDDSSCRSMQETTFGFRFKKEYIAVGSRKDIVSLLVGLGFMAFLTILHFGPGLTLSFLTGDSAFHCSKMLHLADGGIAEGQYLFALPGAILIDALRFLVDSNDYPQLYVINELFWCWLSMQMFYSIISVLAHKLNTAVCIILCCLYAFGYPFYSAAMGFGYFGATTAVICALLFSITCTSVVETLDLVAISILLAAISVGYLLFVPPVFVAVFLILLLKLVKLKEGIPLKLVTCLLVFAFPCILGLSISFKAYFGWAGETESGTTGAIMDAVSQDGATFKGLYANFIFIAPLAIYGFAMKALTRDGFVKNGLFPVIFVTYCTGLFLLCLFSLVSPYYFYKTYAVLWLLFFVFTAIGIDCLRELSTKALVSYACVWIALLAFALGGLDSKLSEKRPKINPSPIAESLFPLYRFNIDSSRILIIDENSFYELRASASDIDESKIAVLVGENEARWFKTLGFEGSIIRLWDDEETISNIIDDSEYVYIDNTFNASKPHHDYVDETAQLITDNYEEVFETDYGTMYKKG